MIFGKKQQPDWSRAHIILQDAQGEPLLRTTLTGLPLMETSILSGSVEWFADPEPCMIHRSAVMKRLFAEWADYIEGMRACGDCRRHWSEVPDRLRSMLSLPLPVHSLVIE